MMITPTSSPALTQIITHLTTTFSVTPTQNWVTTFLSTQKPTTRLPSLLATAKVRFLNAEITTAFEPSNCLPSDIYNATLKERRVQGPIAVQVLDVNDLTQSRWAQIEAIEAAERGEGKKGREIIRVVPGGEQAEDGSASTSTHPSIAGGEGGGGTCKVLLQDPKGVRAFGIELRSVKGLKVGMNIGSKMVLKNVIIARGVLLLEPETTTILGGKIETLHKAWMEERKADLKASIERAREDGGLA
ncbi:MAG: hypothetical protein M1816_003808 [Peltula sp. TS41687]|nr:MAG: hypothetical protein M1816_003808 [Peltula sp. TS41687]